MQLSHMPASGVSPARGFRLSCMALTEPLEVFVVNADGWDGYPAARERLLRSVVDRQLRNPVVIGGDVHSFNVAELKLDFDAPSSPVVASEFVGTSITSQAWPQERLLRYLPDNPHIVFAESTYRGYTRVDVTPTRLTADLRAMDSVQTRDAACRTLASFAVEDGRPGAQRA